MTNPLLMSLFDETERRPLAISELTAQIRGALETRFAAVWVEGEISNFRAHSSGHWYFTIKDSDAQLRATCFRAANARIRFRPVDGLQIRARGRLSVYEPRGEYQLSVEALDPVGAGALRVAFDQLRERLEIEGLFAEGLKRTLPVLPRRVGVVTSINGAALHDITRVIANRTRAVNILLSPARVQGEGASREIAAAIALLNEYHAEAVRDGRTQDAVDVIIVGRGGGSAEDLWAFNEEEVARAIRASTIPVISAVGHETDTTIADFAADVRAPTPSAAAALVADGVDEAQDVLQELMRDMAQAIRLHAMHKRTQVQQAAMSTAFDDVRARLRATVRRVDEQAYKLDVLARRMLERHKRRTETAIRQLSPFGLSARVARARVRFQLAAAAQQTAVRTRLERKRARLGVAIAALDALSPLAVLQRGYALVTVDEGDENNSRLIRAAREVAAGQRVRVRLGAGTLLCRVEETE